MMSLVFLLAQIEAGQVEAWLKSFFWLIAGVGSLLGCVLAYKKLGEKPAPAVPQPFVVTPNPEHVTRDAHEKEMKEIKAELARHTASRKGIYERLEDQGNQITALQTEMTSQTRQLTTLDSKMDRVLERLPRSK